MDEKEQVERDDRNEWMRNSGGCSVGPVSDIFTSIEMLGSKHFPVMIDELCSCNSPSVS